MAIPGQTLSLRDPGLGLTTPSTNVFLFMGCSSIGTANVVTQYSSKAAVTDGLGYGPLSRSLCQTLDIAGGPVFGCKLTGGTAGAASAVTKTAISTSTGTITLAGAAYDK